MKIKLNSFGNSYIDPSAEHLCRGVYRIVGIILMMYNEKQSIVKTGGEGR